MLSHMSNPKRVKITPIQNITRISSKNNPPIDQEEAFLSLYGTKSAKSGYIQILIP